MRVAVIGSAGRRDDAERVTRELYDNMFNDFASRVEKWQVDTAVSGGAAFADHLAVRAFLEGVVKNLVLYLPSKFSMSQRAYHPNPEVQFNPGKTSNDYHRSFSKVVKIDSLKQISQAIERGASHFVFEGFHRRNIEVATNCDFMVAYTFGSKTSIDVVSGDPAFLDAKKAGLKDGGTTHTWSEAWNLHAKTHVNLLTLTGA